jgi:chromosome segregation ATPase
MARGVTQEDVNEAIEVLLRNGERPTIERVRATLGTGSPNTLTRLLDVWWRGLGARLDARRAVEALPGLPAEVADLAQGLWRSALSAAQATALESLAEREEALRRAAADFEQERIGLQEEAEASRGLAAEAAQKRSEAESRIADLLHARAAQEARITGLESGLAAAQDELKQLKAALSSANDLLEQERSKAGAERREAEAAHRFAEDRWLREIDVARLERSTIEKKLKQAESSAQAAKAELGEVQAAMSKQLADLGAQRAAALAKVESLEAVVAAIHKEVGQRLATPSKRAVAKAGRAPRKPKASSKADSREI